MRDPRCDAHGAPAALELAHNGPTASTLCRISDGVQLWPPKGHGFESRRARHAQALPRFARLRRIRHQRSSP